MKKTITILLALVLMLSCCAAASACTEWCGMEPPYFDTRTHTEEELQIEAIQRINKDGNKIIGKYAVVQHYGNLRSSASKYAEVVGQSIKDDEYLILDYTFVDGNAWLKVLFRNEPAWISASLVEISGTYDKHPCIGCVIKITVNSGRARMQPDKNSAIVEYVRYGQEYTVLNSAKAPDNTNWYQIRKGGNLCWVSSGIVDYAYHNHSN